MSSSSHSSLQRDFYPDFLRMFASLWVVCQHLLLDNHIPQIISAVPVLVKKAVFEYGNLGVAIFFTMSGFFMAQSLRKTSVDWKSFPRLLLHRGLRLSPAYYAAILWAIGCAAFISSQLGRSFLWPSGKDIIIHSLYLQGLVPVAIINEVFWTLCMEMQFFCCFCLLIGLSQWVEKRFQLKQVRNILFITIAMIALLWPLKIIDRNFPVHNGFFPLWYACSLGIFANWVLQGTLKRRSFYGYVGCATVVTILARQFFPGTCILTAVSLLEIARLQSSNERTNTKVESLSHPPLGFKGQWIQTLGILSYSLYLVHEPLLKVLFPLEHQWLGNTIGVDILGLLVNIPLCYVIAALLHHWIEIPSLSLSRIGRIART
jgi:peptidoglycan/LPS O-acetylase OafA/YrhL